MEEKDLRGYETSFTYEAVKRQEQEKGDRIMKRFVFILVLALTVFVLYVVHNSRCSYYKLIETEATEDNSSVAYETFKDGYIKYSNSGIEYQEKFGTAIWNESVTLQNPLFAKSENYVLVGTRGGSRISIYNEAGKVNDIRLKNSVIQASISNQGICEVIVQTNDTNLVQVYDKEGKLLIDSKSSINENGYPVTAIISPDGSRLAISYYSLQEMKTQTTMTVYDLSGHQKEDGSTKLGEVVYKEEIVPKLYFYDEQNIVACGDQNLYFYKVEGSMKQTDKISLKGKIQSVFTDKDILGVILDNSETVSDGKYKVCTYSSSGHKVMEKVMDMSYEQVDVRNGQIFAIYKNECTIMDVKGRVTFQGQLEEGSIVAIIPAGGWRNYHVVLNDKVVKIRLQFWSY